MSEEKNSPLYEEWKAKADAVQNLEDFKAFFKELTEHNQSYDSVVWACSLISVAAFKAFNRSPQGGITGFQLGYVGGGYLREIMHLQGPVFMLKAEDLLLPHKAHNYIARLDKESHTWLRETAKERLADPELQDIDDDFKEHYQKLAEGWLPEQVVLVD